jgi:hypothetical protein
MLRSTMLNSRVPESSSIEAWSIATCIEGHFDAITQNIYTGTWWEQRAEAVRAIGELIWGEASLNLGNSSGGNDATSIPPK